MRGAGGVQGRAKQLVPGAAPTDAVATGARAANRPTGGDLSATTGRPLLAIGDGLPVAALLLSAAVVTAASDAPVRAASTTRSATTPVTAPATRPAAGELVVRVTARQFARSFRYPDGRVADQLHLPPVGAVTLVVDSLDVIHSMSVAELRVKVDAVPGRESVATCRGPREPGMVRLSCAEYRGTGHSTCGADGVVHRRGEFETWLAAPQTKPAALLGGRPSR